VSLAGLRLAEPLADKLRIAELQRTAERGDRLEAASARRLLARSGCRRRR